MKYVNLHGHSHHSLLDGLSKIDEIVNVCDDNEYDACALTDHGGISGCVEFFQKMKAVNKKPLLGCELYLSPDAKLQIPDNKKLSHLVVIAKNLKGWKKLIRAVSRSNDDDLYYYKPRLDLKILEEYVGDWIGFSGHLGSDLANCLFENNNTSNGLRPDALDIACKKAEQYQGLFGKENFFIEIQTIDNDNNTKMEMVANLLREVSKKTGIKSVATGDSHYARKKDAIDQRVLLCSSLKTTFPKIKKAMMGGEKVPLSGFFKSDNFHIPTFDDISKYSTEEEIKHTCLIADMCEDYDILNKPKLPNFDCPNNLSESDYVKELCRKGWNDILVKWGVIKDQKTKDIYTDRLKTEWSILDKANLNGYFLIVQDYVNWAKKQNWLVGAGRGSVGGSLTAYLLKITQVDPIPHGLLFSRFYNEGRNTEDHISLPDIDVDFPTNKREDVIDYVTQKYGKNRVCQLVTFGKMHGRAAIKEVLRVHEVCGFNTMNKISKSVPQPAAIADKMQEDEETSTLRWTLKHDPKRLEEYCRLEDDGTLTGDYAPFFEQAIRIEGTYKTQGKHAAGVIISAQDLNDVCPMIRDKEGNKIAGFEMDRMEAVGLAKFDFLGLDALTKLMDINSLLKYGKIEE